MSAELLKKYVGLYDKLDVLKPLGAETSAAGAYLLGGDDADGLHLLARLVAARLGGLGADAALEDHADVIVYPKKDDAKPSKGKKDDKPKARAAVMTVDDVKDILGSLYLTPFELNRRYFIIEYADSMSEICQNKLLKSLEEPPPRVCFILCATRAMLPTVESRCHSIRLAPFPVDTVRNALTAVHGTGAGVELAARGCRGSLGMAERILADKEYASDYSAALKVLKYTGGSRMFASASAVYEKLTRDRLDAVLGLIEYLLADVASLLSGGTTVFDAKDVAGVADGFTPYSAARAADFARDARRRNAANCMPVALMDNMVLKIMEEKALCRR